MDELLTVDEVAAYLRVSRTTVWRWCQTKRVPAFKIGREWRISRPVLLELVAAQQKTDGALEVATGPPQASTVGGPDENKDEYLDKGTVGGGDED